MDLAEDILIAAAIAVWAFSGIRVSIIDIQENRLPTKIIMPTFFVVLGLYVVAAIVSLDVVPLGWALAGAIGPYAAFYGIYLISQNAMGGGDVRLAGLNGLMVGWFGPAQPWLALAAAVILAFPTAFLLVVFKGSKSTAPFGPFMVAGAGLMAGLELADLSILSL